MCARQPSHVARASARGFTIAEMLTVVAIISILAASASPIFINMMRDRRVNRAATQVMEMFRTARTRSLGRNLPILVHWDAAGGTKGRGLLTLTEPNVIDAAATTNCLTTQWLDPTKVHEVMRFDLAIGSSNAAGTNGLYERAVISFISNSAAGGVEQPTSDICFSGTGLTYVTNGGIMVRMTSVPMFSVSNSAALGGTGLRRNVYIPPNGMARLAL
ncbi:MAG: prepilin-type N-terminal cleavage/methylation domain-containing protein [Byssovorax sp.]